MAAIRMAASRGAPVLELNPAHPLIKALAAKAAAGGALPVLDDAAIMLLGQARIIDGETPEDAADFAARIGRLLAAQLEGPAA